MVESLTHLGRQHSCQIATARFIDCMCLAPLGFWSMAPLRYAAKFDPFISLDCAPTPSTLAQSKERKGSFLPSGNLGRQTAARRRVLEEEVARRRRQRHCSLMDGATVVQVCYFMTEDRNTNS